MKLHTIFAIGIVLSVGFAVSAQSKTVTNLDLEKYKTARLEAEKDLRENYAKMGFPSPEELATQQAEDEKARIVLLDKLRAERLERERIDAENRRNQAAFIAAAQNQIIVERQDNSGYLYGYTVYGNSRVPWRSPRPHHGRINWRSGLTVVYTPVGTSYVVRNQNFNARRDGGLSRIRSARPR
jgi:hypothetical protein